eukprot:SAG31_NODE_9092_length_1336_cov_1.932902_1_plen_66_part_00
MPLWRSGKDRGKDRRTSDFNAYLSLAALKLSPSVRCQRGSWRRIGFTCVYVKCVTIASNCMHFYK